RNTKFVTLTRRCALKCSIVWQLFWLIGRRASKKSRERQLINRAHFFELSKSWLARFILKFSQLCFGHADGIGRLSRREATKLPSPSQHSTTYGDFDHIDESRHVSRFPAIPRSAATVRSESLTPSRTR